MSDQGFDQQGGYPPQQPGAVPPPPPPPPGTFPDQPPASQPQQPPAPQPQQPPAYQPAQPQPQPQQPAFGGQPPAQPPAKKGKGGIIALVIAIIVICGLISCGVIGYAAFSGSNDKESIAQAETHLDAAVSAVEVANKSLDTLNAGSPSSSDIGKVVSDSQTQLQTARDEIASARAVAEQWDDSQGKTDYLAALTASTETLDGLQELVAYVDTASGMLTKVKQAGKETSEGNDALEAAIKAGNKSKYSTMRSKGQAAQTHYVKAAVLFREAHKLDKSAGLDKAAKYADLRKKQSDVVVRMAAEGQAKRYSAYNSDIKKMNAYGKDADKVGTPAIAKDEQWAEKRLADIQKVVTDSGTKADGLRKKALQELDYTD